MTSYTISYVLTTYNKLPYLRQILDRLVAARQPDEEIVVCDGGSKDGTPEYLRELYEAGKIQQFVSEPDKGEAHGFNKGMFMARGEIVKIITDDDAFHYPSIRQAANFLLQHPEVDVVLGYTAGTQLDDLGHAYILHGPRRQFEQWLQDKTPFWMVALTLMIRRKSLPLTGLLFTGVVLVDVEFIMRITSLKVNIAWFTGVMSMHVSNPNGNMNRMSQAAVKEEGRRVFGFYETKPKGGQAKVVARQTLEALKRPIRPLKRALFDRFGLKQVVHREQLDTGYVPREGETNFEAAYRVCDDFLVTHNATVTPEFIYKAEQIGKLFQGDVIAKGK